MVTRYWMSLFERQDVSVSSTLSSFTKCVLCNLQYPPVTNSNHTLRETSLLRESQTIKMLYEFKDPLDQMSSDRYIYYYSVYYYRK